SPSSRRACTAAAMCEAAPASGSRASAQDSRGADQRPASTAQLTPFQDQVSFGYGTCATALGRLVRGDRVGPVGLCSDEARRQSDERCHKRSTWLGLAHGGGRDTGYLPSQRARGASPASLHTMG